MSSACWTTPIPSNDCPVHSAAWPHQTRCSCQHIDSSLYTSRQPDLGLLCAQLGQCLWVLLQKAGGHHEGTGAGVVPSKEEGEQRALRAS